MRVREKEIYTYTEGERENTYNGYRDKCINILLSYHANTTTTNSTEHNNYTHKQLNNETKQVPFVPLDIMTNFCDETCVSGGPRDNNKNNNDTNNNDTTNDNDNDNNH